MSLRARIETRLTEAFAPVRLEVLDDSHLHAGHLPGIQGETHFSVRIVSAAFRGKSRVERHRLVYDALGPEFEGTLHALRILAASDDELPPVSRGGM